MQMAKLERIIKDEDFDTILRRIVNGILESSISATLEESSDFSANGARCSVRVFERYSYFGNNRVSLSVTLFENGGEIYVSGVTSGGSQALFFKMNTMGEEAFLDKLRELV